MNGFTAATGLPMQRAYFVGSRSEGSCWRCQLALPPTRCPAIRWAGCETGLFSTYCDGPIREDGPWKRCLFASAQYVGGVYIPPVQNCFIVPGPDQIPPMPLGQPPQHID